MSGERDSDESTSIESAYSVTEETAAFRDDSPQQIDPWVELTDAGADEEAEPDVIDALGWEEEEPPPPPDGPVPAPMDTPPPPDFRAELMADLTAPPRPASEAPKFRQELDVTAYHEATRQLLQPQPVVVERRTPKRQKSTASRRDLEHAQRAEKRSAGQPERRYPKMLSLLQDAADVPYGSAPQAEPAPPPVPGTFFPAPREPMERPAPADLDDLLATMAEGLLIGESPDGGTEVRVTLKDEFFAGTELRIRVGENGVSAELVPPDRDIYWQLNANIEELRERLSSRGLSVQELRVSEP